MNKAACNNCSKGKRRCSGTLPCERCARLGRTCSFAPDERVSKKRPLARHSDDDDASGRNWQGGADSFTSLLGRSLRYASVPTFVSLPHQLFPWQEVRLHHLLGHGVGSAATFPRRRGAAAAPGAEALPHEIDGAAARGSDNDAYVRHLWDVSISAAMEQADSARGDDDADAADDEGCSAARLRPPPPPPPQAAAAASGKRRREGAARDEDTSQLNEISTLADVINDATPAFVCVFSAEPSFALLRLTCNRPCLELFGWSQAEVDLRIEQGVPLRWLHPEDVLVRSVSALNARRARSPEYSFEGRYLRRMVRRTRGAAVAAAQQTSSAHSPRCSQVGPSHVLPLLQRSLRALARVISRQAYEVSAVLPADATAVEATASPSAVIPTALSRAALASEPPPTASAGGRFNAALGSFLDSEDDDIASALGDLDECVKYKVFSAKEVVSHQYWPSGAVHMTVTRFNDIDDGSGVVLARSAGAAAARHPAVLFEDPAPTDGAGCSAAAEMGGLGVVRPHDFDVCDDKADGDRGTGGSGSARDDVSECSDSEARAAAATIAAVSSAAFISAFSLTAPPPGRQGAALRAQLPASAMP